MPSLPLSEPQVGLFGIFFFFGRVIFYGIFQKEVSLPSAAFEWQVF